MWGPHSLLKKVSASEIRAFQKNTFVSVWCIARMHIAVIIAKAYTPPTSVNKVKELLERLEAT